MEGSGMRGFCRSRPVSIFGCCHNNPTSLVLHQAERRFPAASQGLSAAERHLDGVGTPDPRLGTSVPLLPALHFETETRESMEEDQKKQHTMMLTPTMGTAGGLWLHGAAGREPDGGCCALSQPLAPSQTRRAASWRPGASEQKLMSLGAGPTLLSGCCGG
eukprot:3695051-Rhodomonas_salina.7